MNNMVENFKLTVTDEHYGWLEQIRKARGWDSIQEAVRSIIEDAYRMHKKGIDTLICATAPAGKPAEDEDKNVTLMGHSPCHINTGGK